MTATLLAACNDDLSSPQRYDDGQLHLKLSFNDAQGRWAEGSAPGTRALTPTPMTADGMEGLTLYLHCEEQDYIDEPATASEELPETRGQRITGEAFDVLPSFGLYAKDEDNNEVLDYTTLDRSAYSTKDSEGYYESNNDISLTFPGTSTWPDDKTVTFYGYAPTDAPNISVANNASGVPALTYTMQTNEADNKDILTAQKTLTRAQKNSEGVKLEFRHVLSAVKFKTDGCMTCQVKEGTNVKKTYYLKIRDISLKNIYKSGTAPLGGEFTDAGNPNVRTSHWSYDEIDANKGTCSYTLATPTTSSTTLINTDEHCFMVLPQSPANGSVVEITCDLYNDVDMATTPEFTDVNFTASLSSVTWQPGHSYTYTIKDTDLIHKLTISKKTLTYPVSGDVETFTVQSYYTNPDGGDQTKGVPAPWHPQYYDTSTSSWKDGLPLGYVLLDKDGNPILGDDLLNIPGSAAEKEYQLEALARFEDSEVISTLLGNKPEGYGTKDEPVDLSLYNTRGTAIGEAWLGGRNTANCYIVNSYGHFKFPLVYGNAIKNGATNAWAYREMDENEIFVNYLGNHIENPYIIDDVKNDAGTVVASIDDVEPIIVWQDEKNLVLKNSLKCYEESGLGFMDFVISERYLKSGNAILAIREKTGSQRILWSWHIWVSARHYDETVHVSATKTEYGTKSLDFAQWNLGWRVPETHDYGNKETQIRLVQNGSSTMSETTTATQNEGTVTISGSNLYYQHGRKDPLPAAYREKRGSTTTDVDMTIKIHDLGYGKGWTWKTPENVWKITKTGDVPMDSAIQHPDFLFAAETGDWMHPHGHETTKAGRWDPEKAGDYGTSRANMLKSESAFAHIKTVYDPCPYGFTVPPCFAYELLSDWTDATNYYETPSVLQARVYYHGTSGGEKLNKLYFYYTGWRTYHYGGIEQLGTYGYHWTAGVNDRNGIMLRVFGGAGNTFNYAFCRNHTEPVRPVRDNEDERISKLPFIIQGGSVTPESSLSRRK